jgi:hypothetical protein
MYHFTTTSAVDSSKAVSLSTKTWTTDILFDARFVSILLDNFASLHQNQQLIDKMDNQEK